ncbi:molybdopterin-dependent oxidoreductase [Planomonospora sp. ID67723]|uniref:molybdopterin-dependent oxidoreductase n=1 Tax=Planomonospora sp. ID67723 TaxID=2738134 RepID=UPI0018C3C89C|nr:molybdopterin-dependent oxidoreductase [Planomonospora sp. ID67723]MBG0828394.1 molybdopterin-dependent oxidoreductase [Planomonospora sp. ID67723]
MESNRRVPAWAAALVGLVAGAVATGVSLLAAGVVKPGAFPVLAVGDAAVDLSPPWLKDWAIRTFGEADKTVLLAGVLTVLAALAAGVGVLSSRDTRYGQAVLACLGGIGLLAVLTRPGAGPADAVPALAGTAAGMVALSRLIRPRFVRRSLASGPGSPRPWFGGDPETAPVPPVMQAGEERYSLDRRGLLTGLLGGVVVAGATGAAGRLLSGGTEVDAARAGLALPTPSTSARPVPAGADLKIRGLSPFFTPNRDFYRVDTALIVPRVDPREWTLKIHGMVDRPVELTFADLMRRPLVEADVTLCCVSNEVGGPYIGNARWLGARLADLLREAGVQREADMLLSTSDDGWTCGTPVDVVMDGRDALLAVAMNGEALPVDHGFPARQVVPGLYGYVSATKWVTEIKLTRFDRDEAYWTPKGWAAKGPVKTQSRIDLPKPGTTLPPGRTVIAGVAWAQHKGVDAVEVRIDGGPWRQARLAEAPTADTWRQWVIDDWDAAPGRHTIEVRATDATGYTQTAAKAPVAPDGATGWHAVEVTVA